MTREEFWEGVRKSAALVEGLPAWTKAGINLCPTNFENGGVTKEQCASFGCHACSAAAGQFAPSHET